MPGVSDVCTVLSHELRTPLTVLQGYLRLLQRSAPPASAPQLAAMLDATTQLAAIGRQASELAAALRPAPAESSATSVSVGDFIEGVRTLAAGMNVEISSNVAGLSNFAIANPGAGQQLARAIVTIASAVAREAESSRVAIAVEPAPASASLVLRVTVPDVDDRLAAARTPGLERPWFLNGGFGLALVAASLVCDAHAATVTWGGIGQPTTIDIGLSSTS
jgi:signal transduction histidine kinase